MTPYSIEDLRNIIEPIARRYGVQKVLLFGSYARGEATVQSDIDLIVFGGEHFPAVRIFAMAEELRTNLHKNVDVYEIRELEPNTSFHRTVMKEGLEIA